MAGLIDTNTGLGDGAGLSPQPSLAPSPGLWQGGTFGPVTNLFLLLADNSSFLLLADNSSELILAGH